ncbi:KpsF/GutQ family sugar-phosphate isomerase [Simkania negevensis]|uniref:Arabinose 5-phosphate isomerase n=1 Tax=Simkania negevensis (strain ATCC VR-1471 / DSM 27360 / Z) TaxID=331113 RepID=F8L6C0_SIMNZ|nr:KpsF/GutQ family sugar-phosphate isomerase [Simkania negevensis]CCB88250.1 arabinose 5-phosphate isomerase [Simkania negevensis Z]
MLKELFEEYQLNLNHFFDRINTAKAEEIFQEFKGCKGKLIFTGVGKSGIIAEKLSTTMISTGTTSLYLPPTNALHGDIGIVARGDLLICISKSGESEELLNLIPFVKERGAKAIAWVSNPQSRLLEVCDLGIHLPFIRELCPFDLAPTTSTAVQLIFGDVLTMALMKAKRFSLDEYALNHPAGNIGKKITIRVHDLMLKEHRLPISHPNQPLREGIIELTNKRCGCLLITDEEGNLKGIFTDGDLRRCIQKDPTGVLEKPMQELMTPNFFSINENLLAWEALTLMQQNPERRVMMLPVLEGRKLVGLLHMHDIIQAGIS